MEESGVMARWWWTRQKKPFLFFLWEKKKKKLSSQVLLVLLVLPPDPSSPFFFLCRPITIPVDVEFVVIDDEVGGATVPDDLELEDSADPQEVENAMKAVLAAAAAAAAAAADPSAPLSKRKKERVSPFHIGLSTDLLVTWTRGLDDGDLRDLMGTNGVLISGDGLLLWILEHGDVDMAHGGQFLHLVYRAEKFLEALQRRRLRFEVFFLSSCERVFNHPAVGRSCLSPASLILARRCLINHLKGIQVPLTELDSWATDSFSDYVRTWNPAGLLLHQATNFAEEDTAATATTAATTAATAAPTTTTTTTAATTAATTATTATATTAATATPTTTTTASGEPLSLLYDAILAKQFFKGLVERALSLEYPVAFLQPLQIVNAFVKSLVLNFDAGINNLFARPFNAAMEVLHRLILDQPLLSVPENVQVLLESPTFPQLLAIATGVAQHIPREDFDSKRLAVNLASVSLLITSPSQTSPLVGLLLAQALLLEILPLDARHVVLRTFPTPSSNDGAVVTAAREVVSKHLANLAQALSPPSSFQPSARCYADPFDGRLFFKLVEMYSSATLDAFLAPQIPNGLLGAVWVDMLRVLEESTVPELAAGVQAIQHREFAVVQLAHLPGHEAGAYSDFAASLTPDDTPVARPQNMQDTFETLANQPLGVRPLKNKDIRSLFVGLGEFPPRPDEPRPPQKEFHDLTHWRSSALISSDKFYAPFSQKRQRNEQRRADHLQKHALSLGVTRITIPEVAGPPHDAGPPHNAGTQRGASPPPPPIHPCK